jgi:hypothetical protein
VDGGVRAPGPPTIGRVFELPRANQSSLGKRTAEPEIGRGEGVRFSHAQGEVVGRPRAEATDPRDGCDELLQPTRAIKAKRAIGHGAGEGVDRRCANRAQADVAEIGGR